MGDPGQKVCDLALEWARTEKAIADLERTIEDQKKAVVALRGANGVTEGKLDRAAPPRTVVVEVGPKKCVVLSWDDNHGTHEIAMADKEVAEGHI